MSSDSDDDYSYTNSVSVLKKLVKNDVNINSKLESNKISNITLLDDSDLSDKELIRRIQPKRTKQSEEIQVINLDSPENINIDNSSIIITDEETETSPVNIISAIDKALHTGRRKTRSRTKNRNTTRPKICNKNGQSSTVSIVKEDILNINDINYEMSIKVFWKSQYIKKFTLRRFEKLSVIFKHFSEQENISEDRLLFTIKDRVISKNDTPEILNITVATIIEGGVLSAKNKLVTFNAQHTDHIKLKVQMKDRKHPLIISLKSSDSMGILMCQCAEELNVDIKKLKFYFDGDLIKSTDTTDSLQLEDGECIDCVYL